MTTKTQADFTPAIQAAGATLPTWLDASLAAAKLPALDELFPRAAA